MCPRPFKHTIFDVFWYPEQYLRHWGNFENSWFLVIFGYFWEICSISKTLNLAVFWHFLHFELLLRRLLGQMARKTPIHPFSNPHAIPGYNLQLTTTTTARDIQNKVKNTLFLFNVKLNWKRLRVPKTSLHTYNTI